nr:DUF1206 domain-containing protein [Serinicoccus sp. CNJ-927]
MAGRPGRGAGDGRRPQDARRAAFGTVLLLLVAVGLALYGVYSFARARYARMD